MELNSWLREQAGQASRKRFLQDVRSLQAQPDRGWLLTTVVGEIESDQAPLVLSKGSGQRPVPVAILARLGVDNQEQGNGLGAALVKEGHEKDHLRFRNVGIKAMVVHAKDENIAHCISVSVFDHHDRRAPLVRLDKRAASAFS